MTQPPRSLDELRTRMRSLDEQFEVLRRAYYARTSVAGKVPSYEEVRAAAELFVKANYEYQRARYGRVRLRLSISKLLR